MIIKEIISIDGKEYQKIWSDQGYYILNSQNQEYISIINPVTLDNKIYIETDKRIPERMNSNVPIE